MSYLENCGLTYTVADSITQTISHRLNCTDYIAENSAISSD